MINIRQKGAEGEREIYRVLNPIVQKVLTRMNYPEHVVTAAANMIQRNQNQSAVGGNDLSNTFGMSIEVKRQEQLSVNTWWKQCVEAADRNNEWPVLLYRQNGKKWHCVTRAWLQLPGNKHSQSPVTMDWPNFLNWFELWVETALLNGAEVRS